MPLSSGIARTRLHRTVLAGLGLLSAVLGLVGVIVPGLPGTVFVVAASQLFARSSPALDGWLRRNRWLGPAWQRGTESGGMTRSGKAFAVASTSMELAVGWYALAALGPGIQILSIVFWTIAAGTLLLVIRTAPTAGRRHAPSWTGHRMASAGRLLVEPGLLICVTSPLTARAARSLNLVHVNAGWSG